MAWFEFHTNLPGHQKTMLLEDLLGLDKAQVLGHLCLIWCWAMENAVDGDISRVNPKRIAMIAGYSQKKADKFVDALVEAGFLDRDGDSLRFHDWEEYGGKYHEKKKKEAEKKRNQRERKKMSPGCPEDVPSIEKIREEEIREENSTEEEKNNSLRGDDGQGPGESEAQLQEYFSGRGLVAQDYLGANPEAIAESGEICGELFGKFCNREPTEYDKVRLFSMIWKDGQIDPKYLELVCYGFESAAAAGKAGKWSYIEGVLSRLARRGISDLRQAEDYELDRLEGD